MLYILIKCPLINPDCMNTIMKRELCCCDTHNFHLFSQLLHFCVNVGSNHVFLKGSASWTTKQACSSQISILITLTGICVHRGEEGR